MTRVAFTIFGGDGWTGGINYLRNLLSAVADLPSKPVEAVLFIAPETPADSVAILLPFLAQPPVVVPGWGASAGTRTVRLLGSAVLQRDSVSLRAFREQRIDVVFQHAAWYGYRFPMPTLAWIADFQHRHLPQMFSTANRLKRDLGYAALSRCATRLMVSSEDARQDCERFFPASRGRISVLPFCVTPPDPARQLAVPEVLRSHGLSERYFYMPNQLWRHKNHLVVIEALHLLKQAGDPVVIVSTGKAADARNPDHPQKVLALARQYGLEQQFRFLGLVPYEHVMPLAMGSAALINPSLFEGWSTTVEEAKALGVPMVLSDIPLHREQAGPLARYFEPTSSQELAACLRDAWATLPNAASRGDTQQQALLHYRQSRSQFADRFANLVAGLAKREGGATAALGTTSP
ncbi:glycosyltransferase family 4 protein [Roseateles sp. P5_E1]